MPDEHEYALFFKDAIEWETFLRLPEIELRLVTGTRGTSLGAFSTSGERLAPYFLWDVATGRRYGQYNGGRIP